MKILTTILLLFLMISNTKNASAQSGSGSEPAVLNHIAVYVNNLATSTEFYANLFNLQKIEEPFKDGKHTWFSLGQHAALHLIQGKTKEILYDKNEHLCFSIPDMEGFLAKLNLAKILYEDWPGVKGQVTKRIDGVKQIYFQDPDGHWLEVNDAK